MPPRYRYPGTKPFSAEDENVFYGRKQDIDRLYQLLGLKNMLIFYSASGMGKSSLIRAGLIPRLRNEIKEKTFLPITIRFGASDHEGDKRGQTLLDIAIAELVKEANKLQDKKLPFINDAETFSSLWCLVKLFEKNNIHLLLIVDQAEEIFTYKTDAVNVLKEELYLLFNRNIPAFFHKKIQEQLDLLESEDKNISHERTNEQEKDRLDSINSDVEFIYSPLKVKTLFAIREDKLGLFNVFSDYFPDVLKDTYKLLPLSKANATEAITGPAKTPGDFASPCFDFSARALKNLLTNIKEDNDTYDPFSIQLNCSYIEMSCVISQQKKIIDEADIPDEGKIVRDYYKSVWDSVTGTDAEKENYKKEIEEKLIDPKQEIRKYVYEKDLSNISGILHLLQQKGLVRQDQRGEEHYIELSHDRLIKPMIEASRQRIAEENLKKEYEQKLKAAEVEKAAAERRRKKVKSNIYAGIGITAVVIFVVSCVVIWLEARKDKELEIYQSYLTVNKTNPTLAYNIAMYGKAKGFNSFRDLVAKTDAVSQGYITTAFIVPDNTYGTYLSHDKTQIIVVGETEIRYFNKRGLLDSTKPFGGNIIYSSYKSGKGYVLLQKGSMDDYELTTFAGSTLLKFYDYEMPRSFEVSYDGKCVMINSDTFKIQNSKTIALVPNNYSANTEVTSACFIRDGKSIIKGKWNGYIVNLNDSFRNTSGIALLRAVNNSIVLAVGRDNNGYFINIKNKQTSRDNASSVNSSAVAGKILGETFGAITSIGISDDKVIVATEDHQARIYRPDGKKVATLTGHTGKIVNANFSDDGKEIVTASTNGEIFVWKVGKSRSLKGEIRKLSPLDYQILLKNESLPTGENNAEQKLDNLIADNVTYIRQFYSGTDEKDDSSINATLEADYKAVMQPSLNKQLNKDEKRLLLSNYSKISNIQLERADPKNGLAYNALLDKSDSLGISIILIDTLDWQKALEFNYYHFNFYINSLVKANDYTQAVKYSYKKIDLLNPFYLKYSSNTQIKDELVGGIGAAAFYSCYVGRYNDAVQNSLNAIKIDPNQYWLYTNLALGYLFSGRYTEAVDIYTKYKDKPKDAARGDITKVKAGFLADLDEFEKKGIINSQNQNLCNQVQYIRNNILK